MNAPPINVLIVDDHALLRESLQERLELEADLHVVGTASNAEEGIRCALELMPDVVLMDVDMPGLSSFSAAGTLRAAHPDIAIVFVSAFSHDRYIDSALRAHASGYVTKDEPPETVVRAVRATAAGETYFSTHVRERVLQSSKQPGQGSDAQAPLDSDAHTRSSTLTPRELEVLRYIAKGLPKRDIAKVMSLSIKTVSRHTENLMKKLEIHDRVELTRFAIREGLAEA